MKKNIHEMYGFYSRMKKILFVMKLTILAFLFGIMGLSASTTYSQNTKITLDLEGATLLDVFKQIESQSEFVFIYKSETVNLNKRVNVNVEATTVDKILENVLQNSGIKFEINKKQIILTPDRTIPAVNDEKVIKVEAQQPQKKEISGTIKDSKGLLLPGVSVVVKGTTIGTITDAEGQFRLSVPLDVKTLTFSFVGMKSQDVTITGKGAISIVMAEEIVGVDEVVVVGYGTQKKVSLTGAISAIKGADIITTKNENVTNMLAGKVSGVRIVQRTSEPGDFASSIQIRGFGQPLVIIDGVPRDNMPRMDANEIESISILKDASAAIYGVRAANGVVLITTKKGEKGKVQIEYSGFYGVQTPINTPKGLSAAQYMEITNENNINRGSLTPGTLLFSLAEIADYKSGKKTGTEWSRINSTQYAPQYQHNVSATGSTDAISYFINFGNFKQEGIYNTGDLNYERFNLRSNITAKINKNLKVELLLGGMSDTKNSPFGADNSTQYWRNIWVLKPTIPAYTNYNRAYPQETLQGFNPLATTDADVFGYTRQNQKLLQSTGNLIWDVPWIKGLQAKASYSYDYTFWETKSLQRPYQLYQYDLANDVYTPSMHGNTVMSGSSAITRSTRFSANTLMQGSLNYDHTFGQKHHVAGLILYEEGTTNMDNFAASRYIQMTSIEELLGGTALNQQGYMDGSGYNSGANPSNQSGFWEIANKAVVGRVNYDYKSKYYADFSFRYDGSSKFAKGHQWGFFPSASAGWRISEESFIKNNSSLSFINNLKLRGSYGVSGDDRTATFQFVPGYTYPIANFFWPVRMYGDSKAAGIQLKDSPNPNLTWMTSKIYDIGLDADLWKGLLGFEFDVFRRNRSGLMATRVVTLPDWLGEGLAQENLNKDATLGFDLMLKHRNRVVTSLGTLEYGITGNVSVTRTKTIYAERKASVDQYGNWHDNPTNRYNDVWWGYESQGQFQNFDEIYASPILDSQGNTNMKPGDYKLLDWNGDGVVDGWDSHPIATGANSQNVPRVYYGFTLDLQFKGFDLTAVFQGGAMTNVKYSNFLSNPFYFDMNGPDFFYDRWHMADPLADPKDPRTKWIPGTYPTISQASPAMNVNFSANTSTIKRADYLRCKSLELGYTVPKMITDRIGIKGVRIYGTAYNIFTLTKMKYLDPEHPSSDNDLLYPLMRTINFGANVKF